MANTAKKRKKLYLRISLKITLFLIAPRDHLATKLHFKDMTYLYLSQVQKIPFSFYAAKPLKTNDVCTVPGANALQDVLPSRRGAVKLADCVYPVNESRL